VSLIFNPFYFISLLIVISANLKILRRVEQVLSGDAGTSRRREIWGKGIGG
jgi:hypothetical protein